MEILYPIMEEKKEWTIVGSSFGGLMGAIFTCERPHLVRKLVLLAPALMLTEFASCLEHKPVTIMTTIVHGMKDNVVPLEEVRKIAEKVFQNLTYHIVDDDHRLHETTKALDWKTVLA